MLPSDFFYPLPIEPMPALAALRDAVLQRSDKRMPKWSFRIAPDIVTQIQPKPAKRTRKNWDALPWFDCRAVVHPEASAVMLRDRPRDSWWIDFRLSIHAQTWNFRATGIGFHRDCPNEDAILVRNRFFATLPIALAELRPSAMLKPACLMCSKPLTDPVSMARWIGPECFGSASSVIPFVVQLSQAIG
jgi:hypothetical protein